MLRLNLPTEAFGRFLWVANALARADALELLMRARLRGNAKRSSAWSRFGREGFTLIELLVVIAIIAILASMLLSVLDKGKLRAQGVFCMNNHRQLCLAWRMYADDNRDVLVFASQNPNTPWLDRYSWCLGIMDFDPNNQGNWDINFDITKRPLWPYNRNANIYKCPADHSYVVVNGEQKPRVRTMSMNMYVGGFDGADYMGFVEPAYRIYLKLSQLANPGGPPDKIFIFLDEREDCINWGNYGTDMDGYQPVEPAKYLFWQDLPGFYHHRAAGFSFADGHSEIHQWRDERTMPPLHPGTATAGNFRFYVPRDVDVAWMQDHSTRPK
jgi:prepilin-type N-terminal cleavage/methylation domain-containing protein